MLDYLTIVGPFLAAILWYVIRLERKLAKITTDICWIKRALPDPEG